MHPEPLIEVFQRHLIPRGTHQSSVDEVGVWLVRKDRFYLYILRLAGLSIVPFQIGSVLYVIYLVSETHVDARTSAGKDDREVVD